MPPKRKRKLIGKWTVEMSQSLEMWYGITTKSLEEISHEQSVALAKARVNTEHVNEVASILDI